MFWTFLSGFVDICLLRRSPADLPSSTALAVITTSIFLLLSCASEWLGQNLDEGSSHFPLRPLFSVLTSFAIVTAVVLFAGFRSRLRQTWIAFTGCGSLISLVVLPLALSINVGEGQETGSYPLTALTIFFLLIWSIVVDAHIYRHAIGSTFSVGLAIATLTFAILIVLRSALFP